MLTLPYLRFSLLFVVTVLSLNHVWLFVTPSTAACLTCLSFTWVCSNSCPLSQWCHSTISSSVAPFSFCPHHSPHQSLFQWTLHIRWQKYWSFSFSISPSNGNLGLISFRIKWVDLLVVQGTPKTLLQHQSWKASILWCSAFFSPTLTSIHDYWKNHSPD